MEHINTHYRIPNSGLKANLKSGLKSLNSNSYKRLLPSSIDGLFTVCMVIIGIIGCLTVLYLQGSTTSTVDNSLILTGTAPGGNSNNSFATLAVNNEKVTENPRFVEVLGERKAGAELSFVIDAFHTDAEYNFVLANGKQIPVNDKVTKYTFPKAGYYPVNLQIAYQGELKELQVAELLIGK